jgi:hypothetical protein
MPMNRYLHDLYVFQGLGDPGGYVRPFPYWVEMEELSDMAPSLEQIERARKKRIEQILTEELTKLLGHPPVPAELAGRLREVVHLDGWREYLCNDTVLLRIEADGQHYTRRSIPPQPLNA